jgi:hypothetical protein
VLLQRIGSMMFTAILPLTLTQMNVQSSTSTTPRLNGIESIHAIPKCRPGTMPLWSSSGSLFAYPNEAKPGTFVIGSINPFRFKIVTLEHGSELVALTDKYLIVSSVLYDQDWIYPIHDLEVGSPVKWSSFTDTWQEWVNTCQGPAIVTGGYKPGSVRLTLANNKSIPLYGGNIVFSSDRKYGAIGSRPRPKRVVPFRGHVAYLYENQPNDVRTPIPIWDFSAATEDPHRISTLRIPKLPSTEAQGNTFVQDIRFSPNDQYVAVLVNSSNGPKLTGRTFVFDTKSGILLGTCPYGNGIQWLPDSTELWVSPEYDGDSHIFNVQNKTWTTWPSVSPFTVICPLSSKLALADNSKQGLFGIEWIGGDFKPFDGISQGSYSLLSSSPRGSAEIVESDTNALLLQTY